MTLAELLASAREVEYQGYLNAEEAEREAVRLARAVVAALTPPDWPCGYERATVEQHSDDGSRYVVSDIYIGPVEEGLAVAIDLLDALLKAKELEGKSNG